MSKAAPERVQMGDQSLVRVRPKKLRPSVEPAPSEGVDLTLPRPKALERPTTAKRRLTPSRATAAEPAKAATEPQLTELVLAEAAQVKLNPAFVYIESLGSQKSKDAMRGAILRILRAIDAPTGDMYAFAWDKIRYAQMQIIRSKLAERHGTATVNHALSALRGVMHEAFRLGQINGEEWARIKDVEGYRHKSLPKGRWITPDEMELLFKACDRATKIGIRDAAMCGLLKVSGIRLAELCSLTLKQLDLDQGEGRVVGKGNKERRIYFESAVPALSKWLEIRDPAATTIFHSFRPAKRGEPSPLSEAGVFYILKKIAEKAKIPTLSPHDVRRTFISDLLDAGVDISEAQKLAGHENVTTTQIYDRRPEVRLKKAASVIKMPGY